MFQASKPKTGTVISSDRTDTVEESSQTVIKSYLAVAKLDCDLKQASSLSGRK